MKLTTKGDKLFEAGYHNGISISKQALEKLIDQKFDYMYVRDGILVLIIDQPKENYQPHLRTLSSYDFEL